jgi:hypothetical protein
VSESNGYDVSECAYGCQKVTDMILESNGYGVREHRKFVSLLYDLHFTKNALVCSASAYSRRLELVDRRPL